MSLNAPEESNSSASVEDGVECVDDGRVDNLERVHCTAALLRRAEGTARVNIGTILLEWDGAEALG